MRAFVCSVSMDCGLTIIRSLEVKFISNLNCQKGILATLKRHKAATCLTHAHECTTVGARRFPALNFGGFFNCTKSRGVVAA